MFNSLALEVAIGLVVSFAAVALMASAVNEALASLLSLRSRTLLQGVKALLNDPGFSGLALAVYNHGLVHPRGNGRLQAGTAASRVAAAPSYIDPQHFAIALIDHLQQVPGNVAQLRASIDSLPDEQIRRLLQGMLARAGKDADHLRNQVADWFDHSMDRVSGLYKRNTQLATFVAALLLSLALKVDAIHLAQQLWQQHAELSYLDVSALKSQQAQIANGIDTLMRLPIGWTSPSGILAELPGAIPGILITASAAVFGAPFWFDLLQRLVQLRSSGPKPDPEAKAKAAT
jgi:hypothetical protein